MLPPVFTHTAGTHRRYPICSSTLRTALHDRQYTSRTCFASSSDSSTQRVVQQNNPRQRECSESPMRFSITLDRDPAYTSSRTDLRSGFAPPNFEAGRRTEPLQLGELPTRGCSLRPNTYCLPTISAYQHLPAACTETKTEYRHRHGNWLCQSGTASETALWRRARRIKLPSQRRGIGRGVSVDNDVA